MRSPIDISRKHYDRILSEFTKESRLYSILKNGLVIHHFEPGNEFRTVEILCDKFHARMILAAAEVYCRKPPPGLKRRSDFLAHYTSTPIVVCEINKHAWWQWDDF